MSEEFYEQIYDRVDFENLKNIKKLAPLKRIKKELVKKHCSGEKILEIGCGLGEYISMFNSDLYGSDIAFNALGSAKMFCPAGKFFQSNAENISVKNESFDCVLLMDVLEHIENYEKTIEELSRIIKKGGKLVLLTHSSNKKETIPYENLNLRTSVVGEGGDLRRYGRDLIEKFENKNFVKIEKRYLCGPITKFFNKLKVKVLRKKGYDRMEILNGKINEIKNVSFYSKILYLIYKFDYLIFGRLRGKFIFLVMEKK